MKDNIDDMLRLAREYDIMVETKIIATTAALGIAFMLWIIYLLWK